MALGLWQMALVLPTRRRWRAKDAKGTQGGILDVVTGVWPGFAIVRQGSDPPVQNALDIRSLRACLKSGLRDNMLAL